MAENEKISNKFILKTAAMKTAEPDVKSVAICPVLLFHLLVRLFISLSPGSSEMLRNPP